MTDCEYILELHTEIRVQRVGCDGVVLVIARMRLADKRQINHFGFLIEEKSVVSCR